MATNFPGSLDALTNPTSTDGLDSPSHSSQHINANDAVEALQGKVGVDGSGVATSLDFLVKQASDPGHAHTGAALSNIPESDITDGSLLARLADTETVTGAWTFNAGAFLDKGNHVYDVKAYGATGDGVTDDTTAIQNAIDAAVAAGTGSNAGGMVFFPPGTYNITSPLDIPANAHGLAIVGVNQRVSVIEQQTSNVPVLRANHGPTHSIKIHGLTLSYATQQTTTETDAYCLQWAKDADGTAGPHQYYLWSVSDLHLMGAYVGMGIRHLDTGEQIAVWGMYFESIWIQDYSHEGMRMTSPTAVGMPNNRVDHLYIICQNTTPDSYAIVNGAGEWRFTAVEANVIPNRFFYSSSRTVSFYGLHLESMTITENNARIMEILNGSLTVTDMSFHADIQAAGVDLFVVNNNGSLVLDRVDSSASITSGNISLIRTTAASHGAWVRRYQPNAIFSISEADLVNVRRFESEGDPVQAFADADATPSVLGFYTFTTANTGATTITDFDLGHPGQIITVIVADANTTFAHSVSLVMAAGEDWVASDGDVLQFIFDGSAWNQIDSDITTRANTWTANQTFSGDLLHSGTNAGFFGASSPQQGPLTAEDTGIINLTVSGNEITDAVRAAGVEGDGLSDDSSFGIWEATTNAIANGGLETNTTGYTAAGATLSRITSDSKFGSASGQAVTDNVAAGEGLYHDFTATAVVWTISCWVKAASGTVRLAIRDNAGADNTIGSAVTMNGTWQRLTLSSPAALTTATYRAYIETDVQQGLTIQWDGFQAEAQPIATPYVETDGATASRAAARVQAPASLLDETQGWVALRVRMGYDQGDVSFSTLLSWADNVGNRIEVQVSGTGVSWVILRSGASDLVSIGQNTSYVQGDTQTVIAAWESGLIKISVNGTAFSLDDTTGTIPTLAATLFDIGRRSYSASLWVDSDILWAAFGTGTLTDADAATIHGFGDSDRSPASFPGAANVTGVWYANDTTVDASTKAVANNLRTRLGELEAALQAYGLLA